MSGLNLHDLASACRAALATAPEAGGYDVLLHANDDVYALEGASLDGTCNGTDVFRLTALDHDDDGHPVVPLVLVPQVLLDDAAAGEPRVVCASCGRTIDRAPADSCEAEDWHQPQPYVRDADVSAEDGDDLVPMEDADWQAAVGPRPGQTWADLYGRTHVALSYKGAQLEGVTRELLRTRKQLAAQVEAYDRLVHDTMATLAAIVRAHGTPRHLTDADLVVQLRVPKRHLEAAPGEVAWYDDPANDARVWQVER